jgi:hypothetical protein
MSQYKELITIQILIFLVVALCSLDISLQDHKVSQPERLKSPW